MIDNRIPDSISVLSMTPDYYFHYTRFCLHTFFLPRFNNDSPSKADVEAVARCVDAALGVLNLSSKIGPAGRDQLRYFPGFLFVMLSYCSSFVLKAIQAFPGVVPNAVEATDTVRRIADFMMDLGLEPGHSGDAFTAGQSVLRQISSMQGEPHAHSQVEQPSPASSLLYDTQDHGGRQWLQDVFDQHLLDSSYGFPALDERFSFG